MKYVDENSRSERIKVAVAGATGIGKYHAREFQACGCKVVAILGRTQETGQECSDKLKQQFGIAARPYDNLQTLVKKEDLAAISICTPARLHEEQTRFCLEKGLHVLCEKPLTNSLTGDNYKISKRLFSLANKKKRILTVNTQWPAVLEHIKDKIRREEIEKFEFRMESGFKGSDLLMDSLPHPNSMLIALLPQGEVDHLHIETRGDYLLKVFFDYTHAKKTTAVAYELAFNAEKPREVSFAVNGKKFRRIVGENYQQALASDGETIPIKDPLQVSIQKFVGALRNKKLAPLIGQESTLKNACLCDLVVKEYVKGKNADNENLKK